MRLAIHAPNLGLSLPDQPFGKDVANRGLYTALASHGGFEQISFCTAEQPPLVSLQQQFGAAPGAARLSVSSLMQTDAAAQAGTLLRGQPYLSELAWERGHRHGHQAYSLVGMIHTLAPPKVRELIGEVLLAPVQPWDALICTSPAVRQCLEGLLDRWQEHLSKRFGGTRAPRPQLPLLPLGVDQAALLDQRTDQRSRDFLRRHLRLAEHDVLVLWLGRLSFFEKAYPQGMFIALQKAAQRCGRRLHFVMAGWFPGGESDHSRYQEAAHCYAPDVPVHFLDGKNPEVVRCCWAAADLFLSLVDNPPGNFRSGAGGGDGGRVAGGGERLGRLPLHRERWGRGLPSAHPGSLPCQARGGAGLAARPWPALLSGLCRRSGTARGRRHRSGGCGDCAPR